MKIRNGFISNSSSSSFIIVLDKPIEDYSYQEFLDDYSLTNGDKAFKLFHDILASKDAITDYLEDEDNICAEVYCSDIIPYEVTSEIEEKMIAYGKQLVTEWAEKDFDIVDGKRCKYIVSYSDDTPFGDAMEHEYVPHFKGTQKVISHH